MGNIIGEVEYSDIQKIENIDPVNEIQAFDIEYIKNIRDIKQSSQSFLPVSKKYITTLPKDDIKMIIKSHPNILLEVLLWHNYDELSYGDIIQEKGYIYLKLNGRIYTEITVVLENVMRYTNIDHDNIDALVFLFKFGKIKFGLQLDVNIFSDSDIMYLLTLDNVLCYLIFSEYGIIQIADKKYIFEFDDIVEFE